MNPLLQQVIVLVWKDILIDLRRKENFLSMLMFSILTLLLFNFSLGNDPKAFQKSIPGIIWVVFLMAGVLGLNKSFAQEVENGCMGGLLITPVDRGTLFLGKMLGTTLFLCFLEIFFIPLSIIFFDQVPQQWGMLILAIIGGTIGFASLGTLLAAMTATLKGKEILLPLLLFPLMIPSFLSVIHITAFSFWGGNIDEVYSWWKLLLGFDVIFGVMAYLGFEFVMEE